MKLSPDQEALVRAWAEAGATLNDIQNRLREELDLRLTFIDVRFLVLDLNLTLHTEPVEEPTLLVPEPPSSEDELPDGVQFSVDEIMLPSTMASGKVMFTDGTLATWYVDPQGRLGLQAANPGYEPPPQDVASFQSQLQAALRKLGLY